MDMIALGFYACVCGLLSAFAPRFSTFLIRLTVGAVVGIVAAFVLPFVKAAIGA